LKYVINHGVLKGSHNMVLGAVQRINHLFNGTNIETGDFRKQVKDTYPHITGF